MDLKQVATLASCGLTLQEVTAELGVPSKLPRKQKEAMEIAFKRGRASGIARVKQAQFAAALEGKTSAQAELLKRLGGADGTKPSSREEVRVVRKIIEAPDADTKG